MPINGPAGFRAVSQAEFAELDFRVMRAAFECQNQLGRICDEEIYQNDLVARLHEAGLCAAKEVPITAWHDSFKKTYLIDLLVADAGIYELKTSRGLVGEHEAQLLNYLFLCGAHHGKLINFRPAQVESRFVNTTLTQSQRCQFTVETGAWQERNTADRLFREKVLDLCHDWGCRLDLALYAEALVHFSGGADQVERRLPLQRADAHLGSQLFYLLNPDTAFRITALTEGAVAYGQHLRAMLQLSPLLRIQWVNMARDEIQLVTVMR